VLFPLQATLVPLHEADKAEGSVTVNEQVAVHPLLSVTVTL
jgi:hypothetical protein